MKKAFKILGITICTIIVLLYLTFLFVLPKAVDLSKYKEDIQKLVKEQAELNVNYENLKLITTPYLAVGVKAENLSVKLPDDSVLLSADKIKTAISIPQLLLFRIKVSLAEIDKLFVNAEVMASGEDYKIVKLIEDIINNKKAATFGKKPVKEDNSGFDLSSLKIIVPKLKLNNYKVLITDLSTKHYLDLHGDNLIFGYFNAERIKFKTKADLFSDRNKNISLNIDVNTFLPEPAPALDIEDDPAEKVDFPFINPVTTYQNYDLKANIDGKIKVKRNKYNQIQSFGYFNVDDLTMKIATVQIPSSYFHLKTYGTTVVTDTNIYTHEDENLKISGKLKYGKKPNANLQIKTAQIKFSNLLKLSKAVMDSLQIPNELNQYSAEGSIFADCIIKTNFKKLKSEGFIKIADGGILVRNLGQILSKMNINIILADNTLDIKNSEFFIGGSKVKIDGLIDKKSVADISVTSNNVPLPLLFNAFAPKQLRKIYDFKSGSLSSSFKLQGKLKEAVASSNIKLENFDFSDKNKTLAIKNDLLKTSFQYQAKTSVLSGGIDNNKLKIFFPKTSSTIDIPKLSADIINGDFCLNQNIIYFNNKSAVLYSGNVVNYENPQLINFNVYGELNTDDIIKFIGSEMKPYIHSKGNIPVEISFTGNNLRQTLFAKTYGDSENYITPVDFNMLQNLKTSLQAKIDFKPNRIKIKDTGLYTRASIYDEKGKETVITNKIIGVDGTIENNTVNLIKIDIPKTLAGRIHLFPNSHFKVENGILFAYGQTESPLLRGIITVSDIIIPEISTNLDELNLEFKGHNLLFDLNKINLMTSDLSIKGRLNLLSEKYTDIYDFIINSNIFKVEDITTITEKLMSYLPQSGNAQNNTTQHSIPVNIHNGNINIKKLTTGNIELLNTSAGLSLFQNILAVTKLSTDIFNGKTSGDIYINLISMLIKTDLKGEKINVEKALHDGAGLKDALSGIASYSANLLIDGSASTPEAQLKGINGEINLSIKNGQFGPFGKIENLILAENIRESQFFQTALGGIINTLATIDTTHFSELKGNLVLKDGICNINPITSAGEVMNLYILGKFDLLKNYADMKVRVKITSILSNLLGPINAINPINLVNSAASINIVTAKAFSLFCETITEEELNVIPKFRNSYVDTSATKFQLGVRGDANKPLTLIKSFKWLATPIQFDLAKQYADSLPEPTEGNENATIQEAIEQAEQLEAEKKTLKYKIKHIFIKNKEDKKEE